MADEVLFLRLPPELKAACATTVESMNAERVPGQPLHTLNSFVCGVLYAFMGHGAAQVPDKTSRDGAPRARRRPPAAVRK